MAEFIGLKSLLGVHGYKFGGVVPSLIAYEPEELLAKAVKLKTKRTRTSLSAKDAADFARAVLKKADDERLNNARQGLLSELKRELLLFDKIYVCPEEYNAILDKGVTELEDILNRGYFDFSKSAASLHSGPLAEATYNTHRKLMSY